MIEFSRPRYNGIGYRDKTHMCKELGIKYSSLNYYINKKGLSMDEAVRKCLEKKYFKL